MNSQKTESRVHIIVSGIVQGVFFRAKTKEAADRLKVSGWAKNKKDGTVEIIAEGNKDSVDHLVKWCRLGPQGAVVKDLKLTEEEYRGEFNSFNIIY
jgi:acylphosphatase